MDALQNSTRLSLLRRLRDQPDDQDSWAEFVSCYSPMIRNWCRTYGAQASDVDDISQNVLLRMAKYIHRFERKPNSRFRGWLKTVVRHAWCDYVESQREKGSGDDAVFRRLAAEPAGDDLLAKIEEEYDQQLLTEAMQTVQGRVEHHIWRAFELLGIESVPVDDVARQLGITTGNAYVSKNRVKNMLADEVSRLDRKYS